MRDLDLVALIIPILFPVLVGWAAVRARILAKDDAKVLTKFFLYVSAPALIIALLAKEDLKGLIDPKYIAATALLMLFQYGLLFAIHRYGLKRTPGVSAFAAFTGAKFNAVLLGLPILWTVLGHKAVVPLVVNFLIGYFTILPLTMIISQSACSSHAGGTVAGAVKHALFSALLYPLVIATVIGLAVAATGWRMPGWLGASLSRLGAAATPTALVAVGMMLSGHSFKADRAEVAWMSIFRMVISPAMAIGLALVMGLSPIFAVALVVSFGLPTANMVFALAETCGTYAEEAADIIIVTTLSLLAAFPALLWICECLWPAVIVRP